MKKKLNNNVIVAGKTRAKWPPNFKGKFQQSSEKPSSDWLLPKFKSDTYKQSYFCSHLPCVKDSQVSCRDGSWRKINANWVIWARVSNVAKPETPSPVNLKETSLMTNLDATIRMYNICISNRIFHVKWQYFEPFNWAQTNEPELI